MNQQSALSGASYVLGDGLQSLPSRPLFCSFYHLHCSLCVVHRRKCACNKSLYVALEQFVNVIRTLHYNPDPNPNRPYLGELAVQLSVILVQVCCVAVVQLLSYLL